MRGSRSTALRSNAGARLAKSKSTSETSPWNSSWTPARTLTALVYDEYGDPQGDTTAIRYGWLGEKQRSSETVTGATYMVMRLCDIATGRFLSIDSVSGGLANAYEDCGGDPINRYDLDVRFWGLHVSVGAKLAWHYGKRLYRAAYRWNNRQQVT